MINLSKNINLSKPGRPIDLSKTKLEKELDDPLLPGLTPVEEYRDLLSPNHSAYASNPVEGIVEAFTPFGEVTSLTEGLDKLGGDIDDMAAAYGVGRPIESIRERRREAIERLDPDAQLQLERLDPIKRINDLGEAIGNARHGFGRNKDGQICWFVSPDLPTGYAVCTPPKPKPEPPLPKPIIPPEVPQPEQVPIGGMAIKKCVGGYWVALPANPNIGSTLLDLYNSYRISNWNTSARCAASQTIPGFLGCDKDYPWDLPAKFGFAWIPDEYLARNPFELEVFKFTGAGIAASNYTVYFKNWVKINGRWLLADPSDREESLTVGSKIKQIEIIVPTNQPGNRVTGAFDYYGDIAPGSEPFLEWFPACPNVQILTEQPPHQEDIMENDCCLESLELLRLIARFTGASKMKGLQLPATMLTPPPKGSEAEKVYKETFGENETVQIDNIAELNIYTLQQISAFIGSFYFEVDTPKKIKDAAERAGEAIPDTIPVFSIADGIQQLLNLTLNTQDDETILGDLIVRSISESYLARQQATLAYLHLKTLFDWLNIDSKDEKIKIPTLITFPDPEKPPSGEEEILEFIKPSEIELKYPVLEEKGRDFTDMLYPLTEAAQMVRAKWGKRIPKGNEKNFTRDLLLQTALRLGYDTVAAAIKNQIAKENGEEVDPDVNDSLDDKEWREFLANVEQGFANKGTSKPNAPYGRDPSQRPKIRSLEGLQDEVR